MLLTRNNFNKTLTNKTYCLLSTLINKTHSSTEHGFDTSSVPPKNARVVICGGGVMGAAVAYHLSQLGWGADTVLIEQSK